MKTKGNFLRRLLIACSLAVGFLVWSCFREELQWKLSSAAGEGDLSTVKLCVTAGANLNATPNREGFVFGTPALTNAVEKGREEVVRYLLKRGANPNLDPLDSPLIAACYRKHYDIAKLLLEHGADPNVFGEGTPLLSATDQPELITLLHKYGAKEQEP